MSVDEMPSFPEVQDWGAPIDFLERIKQLGLLGTESSSILALALLHKSGKHNLKFIENYEGHIAESIDALRGMGKAVVGLYATDYLCDSRKHASVGKINNACVNKSRELKMNFGIALGFPSGILFGGAATELEKRSNRTQEEAACQCIGALYFMNGLKELIRVFSNLSTQKSSISDSRQDFKTPLQEYMQGKGLKVPKYDTLEVTGPSHEQSFRVRVTTDDAQTFEGIGSSKKRAEQNAAENCLLKIAPLVLKPKQNKKTVSVKNGAVLKYPRCDDYFIENLANNFDLPPEGVNEMALALRHKSKKLDQSYDQGLGCDNQILALLGSAVQRCVSWDYVVREYFRPERRQSFGAGMSNFVSEVSRTEPTAEIYDLLNLQSGLLVGGGLVSDLTISIRSDVVQAVMGVLYRHRKSRCYYGYDLIESHVGEVQSWLSAKVRSAVTKGRDDVLPAKTLFQEKCQALGLTVDYCSKAISTGFKNLVLIPRIGIFHNETPVHYFELPQETSDSIMSAEAAFAKKLTSALDFSYEIETDGSNPEDSIVLECRKVFLEYLLQIIKTDIHTAVPLEKSVLNMGALGTRSLVAGRHKLFCDWVSKNENLLGRSVETPELVEFYKRCGKEVDTASSGLDFLKTYLTKAAELLGRLEPENYNDDIRRTGLLDETNEIGKIFRLKSSGLQRKEGQEILDDLELMFGNRFKDFKIIQDDTIRTEYFERPGAIVELMNEVSGVLSRAYVHRENTVVSLTPSDAGIRFHFKWQEGLVTSKSLDELFSGSKLFQYLSEDLELRDFKLTDNSIDFVVLSGIHHSSWKAACTFITAFHEGQSISHQAYELIASRLHDFKNEIVAFQVAANSSQKTKKRTEKYRLAYSASKHAENAENIVNLINRVVGASTSRNVSTVNLQEFFRGIIADILSWAPATVVVVPPENLDDALVETDPVMLGAILINLCKNAVEAMQSKGRLALEWVFDPERKILAVEVVDSAGAMPSEVCERLNEGLLPSSTKDKGSGIGLLTVGLMLRGLGGEAIFSSEAGIHTRIDLEIPSISEESLLGEQNEILIENRSINL